MKTVVRNMTRSDLEGVGEVLFRAFHDGATRHGYVPRVGNTQEGTAWAWSVLRHLPQEIIVSEVQDRISGVCCLHPRGENGGVGPVAVDPAWQGKGIGRKMMAELMERAGGLGSVRLFQEAFNPASFSLYYGLEFAPVADLLDLVAESGDPGRTKRCDSVSELPLHEADEVSSYDLPRSRYDRRADLAYYATWGKVLVYREGSQVGGWLACLPNKQSVHLGPLVAEGEDQARCLYEHALALYGDRQCGTRVMTRDRALVRALQYMGFRIYCLNMLMVRGAWRPGRYVEAFGRFPEGT